MNNINDIKHKTKKIGEDVSDATADITSTLKDIKEDTSNLLQESLQQAKEKYQVAHDSVTEYYQTNPIKTIGIAAATGFLIAYFMRK